MEFQSYHSTNEKGKFIDSTPFHVYYFQAVWTRSIIAVSKRLVAFLDNHTLAVNDAYNRESQFHSTLLGQHNF